MALNPSNRLAVGLKGFPTLGDPPFPEERKDMAVAELRAAGLPRGSELLTLCEKEVYKQGSDVQQMASAGVHIPGMAKPDDMEWVWLYSVTAELHGWKFSRAWYYWVVRTQSKYTALPEALAKELNLEFGKEVRVDGYGGGKDVSGPVDGYHVDTVRGLAVLVGVINGNAKRIDDAQQASWGMDPR